MTWAKPVPCKRRPGLQKKSGPPEEWVGNHPLHVHLPRPPLSLALANRVCLVLGDSGASVCGLRRGATAHTPVWGRATRATCVPFPAGCLALFLNTLSERAPTTGLFSQYSAKTWHAPSGHCTDAWQGLLGAIYLTRGAANLLMRR